MFENSKNYNNANNKKIFEVTKSLTGNIIFKKMQYNIQLLFIKNLDHEIVLGTDELDRYGVLIDYKREYLQIREEIMKFENKNQNNEIKSTKNEVNMR